MPHQSVKSKIKFYFTENRPILLPLQKITQAQKIPRTSPAARSEPRSLISELGRMGRKAGSMNVNPKKFGGLQRPCLKETMAFLSCLALNNKDNLCQRQKKLLSDCMVTQAGKSKNPWGNINYHLQKLMKGR